MHRLYRCGLIARVERPRGSLHQHLPHLRLLHAGLPDLVEEVQISAHDAGSFMSEIPSQRSACSRYTSALSSAMMNAPALAGYSGSSRADRCSS